MSKQPTPRYDGLRAMREARYGKRAPVTAPIPQLREQIASIPVKRAPKVKRK